ncbi:hypothetical protein SDC9_73356 [bioreactor metagenome]|uniref:Uncharacterized protein n=1 Tax=bioreactor metagenome TaxID=1076179 RepID=A0A644YG30_9ZZZZ
MRVFWTYTLKTKWILYLYRTFQITLMLVLLAVLNNNLLAIRHQSELIGEIGDADTTFRLLFTPSGSQANLDETSARELYEDIVALDEMDLLICGYASDDNVFVINQSYLEMLVPNISADVKCEQPCAYIGENIVSSALIDQGLLYARNRYPYGNTLPAQKVKLLADWLEVDLADHRFLVIDRFIPGIGNDYLYYFTGMSDLYIRIDPLVDPQDQNYYYDLAYEKADQISRLLADNDINVTVAASSLSGQLRGNQLYMRQLWEQNRFESCGLVFLLLVILSSTYLYQLTKSRYAYNVFLLTGFSLFQLWFWLLAEQLSSLLIGIMAGYQLLRLLRIPLSAELILYTVLAGTVTMTVLTVLGLHFGELKKIGLTIKERN